MLNAVAESIVERPFYLQEDVFVAFGKDAAAFLKIGTDKYEGLDTTQAATLGRVVHGWPQFPNTKEITDEEAEAFADYLVEHGYLTRNRATGKVANQVPMEHPEHALVDRQDQEVPIIQWRDIRRFVGALFTGYFWWKCPLSWSVWHVQRLDSRKNPSAVSVDINALRNVVRIFYWIRPWFYEKRVTDPRKQAGLCLFDSLVMLDFLAKYHFYPTLVFGVRLRPFSAHSWVQEGLWVLNGSKEFVDPYECIMTTTREGA